MPAGEQAPGANAARDDPRMTSSPSFDTRDPNAAAFWDERFAAGFTPWDAGGVPAPFARWLQTAGVGARRRILVPGCGAGHEVAALDAAGFEVTAIDYAEQALATARRVLGAALAARTLRQADFFADAALTAQAPFDCVYERAFLAALPPARWDAWAERMAALLAPGGLLVGLFVVEAALAAPRRGPPFATTADELQALLAPAFECSEDTAVPPAESLPVFAGRERWQVWRRRPQA